MFDQHTEVEVESWGSRIKNSFVGIVFGVLLFFASFLVLYTNEGRLDFSQVAKQAVEISANSPNKSALGEFVSISDSLTSAQILGDKLFLNPGKYIAVKRDVDMYGWDESSTKRRKSGRTYSYRRRWLNKPEDSRRFERPQGHYNPPKSIPDFTGHVSQAKVGIYSLDLNSIDLPQFQKLQLNRQNITLTNGVSLVGNYLFQGTGKLSNPQVGDLRIQYSIIPNGLDVTVFGQLENNNRISPYRYQGKDRFYRIFAGNRAKAISTLKREHRVWTWKIRLVGFLMMWGGLALALEPISVILDFFPFLGSITRSITTASTFIVALVMSSVTILVSILLHNLLLLAIAILVGFGLRIVLRKINYSTINS